MGVGRPVEYNDNMLIKAQEYLASTHDRYDEQTHKDIVNLPTFEGLAIHLGVHRDTLYDWDSKYPEFSDIIERLKQFQAHRLINNGLSGKYNHTIAKLILSKHGYADKQEIDHTSLGKGLFDPETKAKAKGAVAEFLTPPPADATDTIKAGATA